MFNIDELSAEEISEIMLHLEPAEQQNLYELLEERAIRESQDNFLKFIHYLKPDFIESSHHRLIAEHLEAVDSGEIKRLMVFQPPRSGKLCAHETPVFTTEGWKTHGELEVGDYVYHPAGHAVRVVAVSEENYANTEVEFTTGETITVHENHEWLVRDTGNRGVKHAVWKVVETKDLAKINDRSPSIGKPKKLWYGLKGKRGSTAAYHLPTKRALEGTEQLLPIDPYFLGVWLGDGRSSAIDFCYHPDDFQTLEKIKSLGYEVSWSTTHKITGVEYAGFKGHSVAFKSLNLMNNKHIPEIYKVASIEQRAELLAGLIDSDGTVDKNSRVHISGANKRLMDDVADLVGSFGWHVSWNEVGPKLSSSGIQGKQTIYKVSFQPDISIPTALPRKQIKRFAKQKPIAISDVRSASHLQKGKCVQVDSSDGLYLVGRTLIPTHNSLMVSEFFPAWYLGRHPARQVLSISYAKDLASDFGRKVRNIVSSEDYAKIFPGTNLRSDSRASFRWHTNKGGVYQASSIKGGIAGKGAHLGIIDDPLNEQDAYTKSEREFVKRWYPGGFSSRLMKNGALVILMTRWADDDLAGHLMREAEERGYGKEWTILKIPAILDKPSSVLLGLPEGGSYWPPPPDEEVPENCQLPGWTLEDLLEKKEGANPLPAADWACMYMQDPQIEGGNIIKSGYWQDWRDKDAPHCETVMISCDTAFSERDTADYSAITIWGIFRHNGASNLLLLGAQRDRWDYPTLRAKVIEEYERRLADVILIEKKASGQSLIQELERTGLPVLPYQPDRDKVARAYASTAMFEGGRVWAPKHKHYAQEVINECAAFPSGQFDDYVDATTQAVLWVRDRFMLAHPKDDYQPDDDELDEDYHFKGYG